MKKAEAARVEADVDAIPELDQLLGLESDGDERDVFRIGDLSREFGVSLRTLRFYEDRGLLSPERRGTTRLYSRKDRARLRLVLLGKLLGFSLTEARQIIDIYGQPNGKRKQLEVAFERFAEQKEALLAQRQEIERSLDAMDRSIDLLANCLRKA